MIPDESDVRDAVRRLMQRECELIERFQTGPAHFVFDVRCANGTRLVARLTSTDQRDTFVAALHWSAKLRALDVPLPVVLASDLEGEWPVILLERLQGNDLQDVFPQLTQKQRTDLAQRVSEIQSIVGAMPIGPGFGYARSYDDPDLFPTWTDVLSGQIERSRKRISLAGIIDVSIAKNPVRRLDSDRDLLERIAPTPFLDDTTTKNVIVHGGKLTGIVDVDWVCFGDPIFPIALTRVAILSRGWDAQYVKDWFRFAGYNSSERWRLDLYTSVFALGLLAEFGHSYNRATALAADQATLDRLMSLL